MCIRDRCCRSKSRPAVFVHIVDACAGLEKEFDDGPVTLTGGEDESGAAVAVLEFDVHALLQQQAHDAKIALEERKT